MFQLSLSMTYTMEREYFLYQLENRAAGRHTNSKVTIDVGEYGRAGQLRVRGDNLRRSIGTIFLGQAQVRDVDAVPILPSTHQEILGFNISMDHILRMDTLQSADQLIRNH
jgi:hypothetical protein